MSRWFFVYVPLVLTACRGPVSASPGPLAEVGERGAVWVDVAGRESGDGSREHPLRSLAEALARPGRPRVHLAPGRYVGPFRVPDGARLIGAGQDTVVWAEAGAEAVLRLEGRAELSGLAFQGGQWGLVLDTDSEVRLKGARFSGQSNGAIHLTAGTLWVERSHFEAQGAQSTGPHAEAQVRDPRGTSAVGIHVEAREGSRSEPRLDVRETEFVGPYRRAVRVRGGGRARLQDVHFDGTQTAVGQDGGWVELVNAVAEGGRGPAFSVVEGSMSLSRVRVLGHEYGLTSMHAKVAVRDFTSVRAERAGLGVSGSDVLMEGVVVQASGTLGGVQLTDSKVTIRGLRVDGAAEYGLVAVRGSLRLRDGAVTRVRSATGDTGEGLHLREVAADVAGLEVRDVEGACVWAAQAARVLLRDAALRGCTQAGLSVDTEAHLEANGISVSGKGHALAAMNGGVLSVDGLRVEEPTEPFLWAECESGTKVILGRVRAPNLEKTQVLCLETRPSEPTTSPRP
ncbi:hypothetical protein JGU66_09455 [Myxococcaceae bacterium JPH2]|nr:hypothetical protein [Myxococcaceae bacterium JPH2]